MGLTESQKEERKSYLSQDGPNLKVTTKDQEQDYVFISYKSDNWEKVFKEIVIPLQKKYGLRVYCDIIFDDENSPWINQFTKNMESEYCKAVLIFLSKEYCKSYATMLELLHSQFNPVTDVHDFKCYNKPVIPILLDDMKTWDTYNQNLCDYVGPDKDSANGKKEWTQLKETTKYMVKYLKKAKEELNKTNESLSTREEKLLEKTQAIFTSDFPLCPWYTHNTIQFCKEYSEATNDNTCFSLDGLSSLKKTIASANKEANFFDESFIDLNYTAPTEVAVPTTIATPTPVAAPVVAPVAAPMETSSPAPDKENKRTATTKPTSIVVCGVTKEVASWKDVLLGVCEILSEKDSTFASRVAESDKFNTSQRTNFTFIPEKMENAHGTLSNGLIINTKRASGDIINVSKKLAVFAGFTEDDVVVVVPSS